MTLDEAIKHAQDVYEEHRQLAVWLSELSLRKSGLYYDIMVHPIDELDEVIASCKAKAECDCTECGMQHKQIADWLTELKELRNPITAYQDLSQPSKEGK